MTKPTQRNRAAVRERLILHATAAAVTLLVLAPLVCPGYVLSYDMVFVPHQPFFVPHQPLTWELIAPTTGLPRAVPQDAVVSLLSLALPGWLLQRLALAGAIYAAALGAGAARAGRAATDPRRRGRRLRLDAVPRRAAADGTVGAAARVRRPAVAGRGRDRGPGGPARRPATTHRRGAICAITPTGGLVALVTTAVLVARRSAPRRTVAAIGSLAALNLPWLVAAMLTTASGRSDPDGVAAFAARGENWSGPLGALAGTGGIWNAQTTPASRASVLVPVVTVVLIGLAGYGFAVLRRRWPHGTAVRLAAVAAGGVVIALLGTLPFTADALAWAVRVVPGAGLLRDGQKFLAPYALLLILCAALGAERLAERLAAPRARLLLVAMVVLPVAAMPDLAFGGSGALRPVDYPADWDRVAATLRASPGPVLALPFDAYRGFAWNNGRTVIDPATRYLPGDVLVDDTLVVGDLTVDGEDPRARHVRGLVADGASVAQTGVRWVLVEHDAGPTVPGPALVGLRLVHTGPILDLYDNPQWRPADAPSWHRWLLVAVHRGSDRVPARGHCEATASPYSVVTFRAAHPEEECHGEFAIGVSHRGRRNGARHPDRRRRPGGADEIADTDRERGRRRAGRTATEAEALRRALNAPSRTTGRSLRQPRCGAVSFPGRGRPGPGSTRARKRSAASRQVNRSACALAAAPISRRRGPSASSVRTFPMKSSVSSASNPVTPSTTASVTPPPVRNATVGVCRTPASTIVRPHPSFNEGMRASQAEPSRVCFSSSLTKPANRTRSVTPRSAASSRRCGSHHP